MAYTTLHRLYAVSVLIKFVGRTGMTNLQT